VYTVTRNYLEPEIFQSLKNYAFNEINDSNLSFEQSDDYVDSAGILAYNMTCSIPHGYDKLMHMYPGYRPYLDNILKKDCNVTHIIVLKMKTGSVMQEHVDDGITDLISDYSRDIRPSSTNVLYVNVPENMEGGQLYIKTKDGTKYVTPEENMRAEFQGGIIPHGVTRVVSKPAGERHMIVCEQYKLSLRCLRKLQKHGDPILRKG